MAWVEVRTVDEDGHDVGVGQPGEILTRGPDRFAGYTDPALTAEAVDEEGWFRTGDVGVLDAEGYLTITDRVKDIIIRGGENVSAAEVEQLLAHMKGVAEVALVAAPDERLGEHGCAFFRMQPGCEAPDLEAVRTHLAAAGLARQKWPEELRVVDELPRTASGKVQKFVLREQLAGRAGDAPAPAPEGRTRHTGVGGGTLRPAYPSSSSRTRVVVCVLASPSSRSSSWVPSPSSPAAPRASSAPSPSSARRSRSRRARS